MKKYKIAIVFNHSPFEKNSTKEGLDFLLATSAFCQETEMAIIFQNDGVYNLLPYQQPNIILQKNHIDGFKLISLYELSHCFICETSLRKRNISPNNKLLLPNTIHLSLKSITEILEQSERVFIF